jgi:hypothetical protein
VAREVVEVGGMDDSGSASLSETDSEDDLLMGGRIEEAGDEGEAWMLLREEDRRWWNEWDCEVGGGLVVVVVFDGTGAAGWRSAFMLSDESCLRGWAKPTVNAMRLQASWTQQKRGHGGRVQRTRVNSRSGRGVYGRLRMRGYA